MRRNLIIICITIFTAIITFGQTSAPQAQKSRYVPTGEEGIITGTIYFKGKVPETFQIDMSQDYVCAQINPKARLGNVVVTKGRLANAVVYVESGDALNTYSFEAPSSAASLYHKGCQYVPHVLGIQTYQPLLIINSDPTIHNTHSLPRLEGGNEERNVSQPPGTAPIKMVFAHQELFIKFKDNQHPWEKAYVWVFSHPFFAVSDKDGSYKIEGLPPGDYTIRIGHEERLDEQTVKVTISPHETKTLDFTFKTQDR
ncbi:MAG: carboxypeptidase regulatory-like domain-containing protein [Acidobacteriota bacterium]|nr:carboxypeptidase regulatory-like domain-containing protein [Acidobacteriota bacterium]